MLRSPCLTACVPSQPCFSGPNPPLLRQSSRRVSVQPLLTCDLVVLGVRDPVQTVAARASDGRCLLYLMLFSLKPGLQEGSLSLPPFFFFFSYKQSNAYISSLYFTPLELHESPASSSSEHLHCSWKASVPSVPTHLLPQVSTADSHHNHLLGFPVLSVSSHRLFLLFYK